MQPLTIEWIQKAERDFKSMRREYAVTDDRNNDDVCFHAQQCIEKLLKANLTELDIRFGKVHDLEQLLELILPLYPEWEALREDCGGLSEYAVIFRYPGDTASDWIAKRAFSRCEKLRVIMLDVLGVPGQLGLKF
jgi:HEPN domain-containing protein